MPAERCPRCGTARAAGGCACQAVSPVEETAVLPHLEGPPLVRPYVAGASVVEPGDPARDPFAARGTQPPVQPAAVQPIAAVPPVAAPPRSGPPVAVPTSAAQPPAVQPITGPPPSAGPPPPGRPPHVPQAASPFGPPQPTAAPAPPHPQPQPRPDAAATQLLPPVPPQQSQPQPDAAATQLLPPVPPQQQQQAPHSGAPGRFVPIPPPGQGAAQVPVAEQTMPLTLGPVTGPRQHPSPLAAAYPPVGAEQDGATRPIPLDLQGDGEADDARGGPDGPGDGPWAAGPGAGADLGMFTFREDGAEGPVSRADRREQRRQTADRRRLVIAGGAVGVTALGATLAMLLSSSSTTVDKALPAPTGPAVSSPAEVSPSPTDTAPAAESSAPAAESPSPTRTTARPTQAVTTKAVAPPTTEAPSPPGSPSASRTATPSATPGATLRLNDTGPDVAQMQQLLMAVNCDRIGPLDSDRTSSNQPGFGYWTQSVLASFQRRNRALKGVDLGVYDPQTRSALQDAAQHPDC
ncbi:peptidoglycan-binding domain-containing protein [Kitasatospora cineracea]|uniref:peptidoglycan-binding domain-containing protein n=1 Tax=Kitasatospora cineracea TaxID=88074 RepID=UPI0033D07263